MRLRRRRRLCRCLRRLRGHLRRLDCRDGHLRLRLRLQCPRLRRRQPLRDAMRTAQELLVLREAQSTLAQTCRAWVEACQRYLLIDLEGNKRDAVRRSQAALKILPALYSRSSWVRLVRPRLWPARHAELRATIYSQFNIHEEGVEHGSNQMPERCARRPTLRLAPATGRERGGKGVQAFLLCRGGAKLGGAHSLARLRRRRLEALDHQRLRLQGAVQSIARQQ
eukprot:6194804-Pleurochrysis_carterae.AAC.4